MIANPVIISITISHILVILQILFHYHSNNNNINIINQTELFLFSRFIHVILLHEQ